MTSATFPATADLSTAQLRAVATGEQRSLAEALAAMQPWTTLDISADELAQYLSSEDGGAQRYAVAVDGALAGIVSLRFPWLKGPYIELLAVLPTHQGHGLGTEILSFVEAETRRFGGRNVWVCASGFNDRAQHFYRRCGFVEVGSVPDLVADGFSETLLRKPLT
ncbi:MAG: GNAT family N-acetyltransferase [Methyloceanibacter sp.]|nr:GNAT family N-acetyltransferase [Methyloceanibacter sp.]